MTPREGRSLVVYGAGGFGREVAWLASRQSPGYETIVLADDGLPAGTVGGLPVMPLEDAARTYRGAEFVVAVGSAAARELMARRAESAGLRPARLVDPSAKHSSSVMFGVGTIICADCILTVDVTLGRHVHVNLGCTVGHDAVLEDFVTLAPGVHVSGWVRLERGSYIGTGAVIINGTSSAPLVVGAGAVIGAGAVVAKSIPPGVTAVGVPARVRG